ncbi:site-specific integrase [Lysinibacillus sp. RC79]|uniref:site-specific integrase n=1 Tax=Lysinibacillus sp. RC79 TaxID=3156296 RepID=UPI003514DB75
MNKTKVQMPITKWHQIWFDKMDMKLMCLQNSRDEFLIDKIDERIMKYLHNNSLDFDWRNHLLLIAMIETDSNKAFKTIKNHLSILNARLKDIFKVFSLINLSDFDVDIHFYKYLKGEVLPNDSYNKKSISLRYYNAASYDTNKWVLSTLSIEEQEYLKKYLFKYPSFDSRDFTFTKLAIENAQTIRKDETDAVVPNLPAIRAEANFRWNQMNRIRDAFQKQINKVETESIALPSEFYYDEPDRIGKRFYFRLWDKPSFVLSHHTEFSDTVIKYARERKLTYSVENNAYFLEFIRSQSNDACESEDLWFNELIKKNVLGNWNRTRPLQEHESILNFLSNWGYKNDNGKYPMPFGSQHKGILLSSTPFFSLHKDKVKGLLIDVEPFYVACKFGLLAIDILTTTGARISEVLQINNTKECIQAKKVKDRLHFSFKAIPKGRDTLEEFYISKQTMNIIQTVVKMLKEHYDTQNIPSLQYNGERNCLFSQSKPYYFQYKGKLIKKETIYGCIRFLLHGIVLETQDGQPVKIKTHLLRHAFATEAVQRQKMPIDIVAEMLHQKDLNVTGYYSAPTPTQIAESIGELHDVISSYVDIDDAYLRNGEKLQKELDNYMGKVGVFNKVLGGTCVTDYVCPTKMQCLGCKAKIPEPDQEDELFEVIKLSKDMEKRFKQLGLEVEVRKAKEMAKQAKIELREIDLIKKYREERQYEPTIQQNTFRSSMVRKGTSST